MPSFLARRAGRVLAIVGISVLTLVVAILALLQIPALATWAANRLLGVVPLSPGYSLEVTRVSGNWLTGLELEGVRLRHRSRELALVEHLRLRYDPRELRGPNRRLRELVVDGARLAARRERNGWDVANALRSSRPTRRPG